MFCATLSVAVGCVFACTGTIEEYRTAWHPTWDNARQEMVDQRGAPMPPLYRVGNDVLWEVDAEPGMCAPRPALKPIMDPDAPVPELKP